MVTTLSWVRTLASHAYLGTMNKLAGKGYSSAEVAAASRIRIAFFAEGEINSLDLRFNRGKLKLAIARALVNAGKMPESGIVKIGKLSANKDTFVKEVEPYEYIDANDTQRTSESSINYKVIDIHGFTYKGTYYPIEKLQIARPIIF